MEPLQCAKTFKIILQHACMRIASLTMTWTGMEKNLKFRFSQDQYEYFLHSKKMTQQRGVQRNLTCTRFADIKCR